ncbi:MAG: glycogen synthase [Patescibacteria group bacterium]|nr:glycogen synthase [Patescibacteria group bacterium]MDD5715965.1 glycogen synthase [Patescibacteria group bacterium]
MAKTLRIASISSEVSPYSKTGGLADVTKALSKALSNHGHKVSVVTPFYKFIKDQDLNLKRVKETATVVVGRQKFPVSYLRLDVNPNLAIFFVVIDALFTKRSNVYGYPDDNLRFLVFNIAALRFLDNLTPRRDIIHCHDWQAGLVPYFLTKYPQRFQSLRRSATVFTIHNLTFQSGKNWWSIPKRSRDDGKFDPLKNPAKIRFLNFTKRGILYADTINTVSERYAEEILTPEYGQGLDKCLRARKTNLYGIINGIDYTIHNPAFDGNIRFKYDWNSLGRKKKNKLELQKIVGIEQNPEIPLIGVVNRLTEQKGFRLIMETFEVLMRMPLQIVILGSGFLEYITFFKKMARTYPRRFAFFTPFSEQMESKIYAGSDMFLMPSRFEPCGISQLKSLRYGSIPIVHETGGLSDTITNYSPRTRKGNGFVFKKYAPEDFLITIARALENYKYSQAWEYLVWSSMQQTYSWELPARKYLLLYSRAIKTRPKNRTTLIIPHQHE